MHDDHDWGHQSDHDPHENANHCHRLAAHREAGLSVTWCLFVDLGNHCLLRCEALAFVQGQKEGNSIKMNPTRFIHVPELSDSFLLLGLGLRGKSLGWRSPWPLLNRVRRVRFFWFVSYFLTQAIQTASARMKRGGYRMKSGNVCRRKAIEWRWRQQGVEAGNLSYRSFCGFQLRRWPPSFHEPRSPRSPGG